MSAPITFATTRRILAQLRNDHRTVGLLIGVPSLLMILLRYVLNSQQRFSAIAPALLGIFPFTIMFLLTSITTLRERTTGTLERLMTMPIGKLDLLFGYALAFGLLATLQVVVAAGISLTWLGLDIAGSVWSLLLIVVLDALLGTALRLFVPRDEMGWVLSALSDVLPLSYAVDALTHVTRSATIDGTLVRNVAIIAGCAVLALFLGAATLRRRTP
jgi:ABC-2 type transport system permease protein